MLLIARLNVDAARYVTLAVLSDTEVGAGVNGAGKQTVYLAEGIIQVRHCSTGFSCMLFPPIAPNGPQPLPAVVARCSHRRCRRSHLSAARAHRLFS